MIQAIKAPVHDSAIAGNSSDRRTSCVWSTLIEPCVASTNHFSLSQSFPSSQQVSAQHSLRSYDILVHALQRARRSGQLRRLRMRTTLVKIYLLSMLTGSQVFPISWVTKARINGCVMFEIGSSTFCQGGTRCQQGSHKRRNLQEIQFE
jgi:hypothetical protein